MLELELVLLMAALFLQLGHLSFGHLHKGRRV